MPFNVSLNYNETVNKMSSSFNALKALNLITMKLIGMLSLVSSLLTFVFEVSSNLK
jgi:hypothetical protein